jgi:hypothetical protein
LKELEMFVSDGQRERNARVRLGLAVAGEWIGRVLPAEVLVESDAPFSATAHVFDILAPYFLTSQGKSFKMAVIASSDSSRDIRQAETAKNRRRSESSQKYSTLSHFNCFWVAPYQIFSTSDRII